MDQPSYDQIALINQRLASLQQEVLFMEDEYGFSKDFTIEKSKNLNYSIKQKEHQEYSFTARQEKENKQTKDNQQNPQDQLIKSSLKTNRYHKLPQVKEIQQCEKFTKKPQISATWKEIFQEKPSLSTYYEERRFLPVDITIHNINLNQFEQELSQENFKRYYIDLCKNL